MIVFERFITLEGGEGSGKTTVAKELKKKLENLGYEVCITREPGGSKVGEEVRNIIMNNEVDIHTEALLFAASRVDHIKNVILKALKEDKIVICDRYIHSSIVYQQEIGGCKDVEKYNKYAIDNCMPRYTIFFDINPSEAFKRIENNQRDKNRFDKKSKEYHTQIYNAYLKLTDEDKNIIKVDASQKIEAIVNDIIRSIKL